MGAGGRRYRCRESLPLRPSRPPPDRRTPCRKPAARHPRGRRQSAGRRLLSIDPRGAQDPWIATVQVEPHAAAGPWSAAGGAPRDQARAVHAGVPLQGLGRRSAVDRQRRRAHVHQILGVTCRTPSSGSGAPVAVGRSCVKTSLVLAVAMSGTACSSHASDVQVANTVSATVGPPRSRQDHRGRCPPPRQPAHRRRCRDRAGWRRSMDRRRG